MQWTLMAAYVSQMLPFVTAHHSISYQQKSIYTITIYIKTYNLFNMSLEISL